MTTHGTYTAVVDRFEDDLAVLLLEENGETVGEAAVDRGQLPEDGRHVDAVLSVEMDEGDILRLLTWRMRRPIDPRKFNAGLMIYLNDLRQLMTTKTLHEFRNRPRPDRVLRSSILRE